MNSLYLACHGIKVLYVVWHDVWSNKGFRRRLLGVVESKDETLTTLRILGLLCEGKIPLEEGGRNNITLTLADAETVPVVDWAKALRRF